MNKYKLLIIICFFLVTLCLPRVTATVKNLNLLGKVIILDATELLFGHINNLAVIQLISNPHLFAFFAAFSILVLRWSVFIDFLTFFRNNLHVLFSGILYHSEIFLAEHLGHIVTAHQCNHKCYGKYHCNIEKVAYHTHRVAIFFFSQQTPFHYSFWFWFNNSERNSRLVISCKYQRCFTCWVKKPIAPATNPITVVAKATCIL